MKSNVSPCASIDALKPCRDDDILQIMEIILCLFTN